MKTNVFKMAFWTSVIALGFVAGCKKKSDEPATGPSGSDVWDRKFVTLTWTFPDPAGEEGNGGTNAYAITLAQAADPNYEVNAEANGYGLRSQRTARVQGSINGNFLYNIQYTGTDGGIFNKYKVNGAKDFVDTREEVNTEPILGTSPRWVIAAEDVGVGVFASSTVQASAEGAGADFIDVKSTIKIAVLSLGDPKVTRQAEFTIPFTAAQTKDGYQIGRADMPILNKAKTKIFIGCNLTRTDVTKKSTVNSSGAQTWSSATNQLGTATLVVDYPSLANPKLIYSTQSAFGNHGYRTMIQHLDEEGNIYQATGSNRAGYPHILKIDKSTDNYDNTYLFNLNTALGTTGAAIKAWRYAKEGVGLVAYTISGAAGVNLALVDLKAKSATKLNVENQSNAGFAGATGSAGTFNQFQNIAQIGDNFYIPMTPSGSDGNLYIINYKTKQLTKGAKLKNSKTGSFYLGAY